MGLFDSFFETEQESRSRSEVAPYGPAEDVINRILRMTMRAAGEPLEMYPGQLYAPQTEAERAQIASLTGMAEQYPGMVMPAFGMALNAPDVAANPYVTGMAEAIQSQVNRNLTENILPAITMGGVGTGGFGTSEDISRGLAARGTSEVLSEALAGLYGSAYGQGLGAQANAFGMLPTVLGGQAGLYGQAGALERAEDQRAIDEARARFDFAQMEPYQRAGLASGIALPIASAFPEGMASGRTISTPSSFTQLAGLGTLGTMGAGALGQGFGGFGMPMYNPNQAFQMGGYYADPRRPWG